MGFIFICLAAGGLIGFFKPPSKALAKYVNFATMAGLFILLVSMGAQLGSNKKVVADLGQMGFQAFVLAGMSVLGSICLVRLLAASLEKRLSLSAAKDIGKAGENR